MEEKSTIRNGSCTCGDVRYRTIAEPLIVHGCHCHGCQRNSGSAFALNALFETEKVEFISGQIEDIEVPTPSGKGQMISRCRSCKVAVWSTYNMGGLRDSIRFVRVGTLEEPGQLPPDVHIYTSSKQPWVTLTDQEYQFHEFYEIGKTWSFESLKRLKVLEGMAGI